MIGDRIRRLRTQLGLSQTQLAGKEMTRAFISQVEHGKCTPSPQTLRILADRLGKSVSYFLDESPGDSNGIKFLWDAARLDMAKAQWNLALPKLEQALQWARRVENLECEAEIRSAHADCLSHLGLLSEALDSYDEALESYRALGKAVDMLKVWLEMGNCYFMLEQHAAARRLYEKVSRQAAGLKSAQEVRALALCYLGSTRLVMGQFDESVKAYREALTEADPQFNPVLWGRIATGLAAAYRRTGELEMAKNWSRKALERLRAVSSPRAVDAQHNLAIAHMELGQWEESYAILQSTLSQLAEQGNVVEQANVMEDLVRYWRHKQQPDKAEALCWQALDLLNDTDASRLRGFLYRHLGEICIARSERKQALGYLKISKELFRQVRAPGELMRTLDLIEAATDLCKPT